jgi:hypothetical protein
VRSPCGCWPPVRRSGDHIKGAVWGASASSRQPGGARWGMREPVSGLLSGYAAVVATGWLAMVRRRSTVRFRKGALVGSKIRIMDIAWGPFRGPRMALVTGRDLLHTHVAGRPDRSWLEPRNDRRSAYTGQAGSTWWRRSLNKREIESVAEIRSAGNLMATSAVCRFPPKPCPTRPESPSKGDALGCRLFDPAAGLPAYPKATVQG